MVMLGSSCSSCCGTDCTRCVCVFESETAVGDGCYFGGNGVDQYTCTVIIPDAYSLPVTIRVCGGVDDDLKINGVLIEPGLYPYVLACNGAHQIGGGAGYTTTVNSRTVTLTCVDNYQRNAILDLRVCVDPDNEQGLCEKPTTDCPSPFDDCDCGRGPYTPCNNGECLNGQVCCEFQFSEGNPCFLCRDPLVPGCINCPGCPTFDSVLNQLNVPTLGGPFATFNDALGWYAAFDPNNECSAGFVPCDAGYYVTACCPGNVTPFTYPTCL